MIEDIKILTDERFDVLARELGLVPVRSRNIDPDDPVLSRQGILTPVAQAVDGHGAVVAPVVPVGRSFGFVERGGLGRAAVILARLPAFSFGRIA